MIMDNVESKCIKLFKNIGWEEVGKGDDYEYYRNLLFEFFRRATLFCEVNNIECHSPWSAINNLLPESTSLSQGTQENINEISARCPFVKIYVLMTLTSYVLFEKARNLGIVAHNEKNIYSPLVKMFDSKGAFHSHHGFFEFNDLVQIPYQNQAWKGYQKNQYVEFDEYF